MIDLLDRLLCRFFGHPNDAEFSISFCDDTEPVLVGCGRCGATLTNRLSA